MVLRMRRKYLGTHFDDWAAMRMRGKPTQATYTNSHDTVAHFSFVWWTSYSSFKLTRWTSANRGTR